MAPRKNQKSGAHARQLEHEEEDEERARRLLAQNDESEESDEEKSVDELIGEESDDDDESESDDESEMGEPLLENPQLLCSIIYATTLNDPSMLPLVWESFRLTMSQRAECLAFSSFVTARSGNDRYPLMAVTRDFLENQFDGDEIVAGEQPLQLWSFLGNDGTPVSGAHARPTSRRPADHCDDSAADGGSSLSSNRAQSSSSSRQRSVKRGLITARRVIAQLESLVDWTTPNDVSDEESSVLAAFSHQRTLRHVANAFNDFCAPTEFPASTTTTTSAAFTSASASARAASSEGA